MSESRPHDHPVRPGPPHNPDLRSLVEGKQRWHRLERRLSPPLEANAATATGTRSLAGSSIGFLHERGYVPHFDAPYVTQFVTFMLHDAFPVTRRREWESALHEPKQSERRRKLEAWLDRRHGECWLGRASIAEEVERALREEDGRKYRLQAWVIMPNHVHLVVDVWGMPLSGLIRAWKGSSARAANLILERMGPFWERDYFDTLIRDEEHLKRAIRYTESNPVKAGLVRERKEWPWSSAALAR